MLKGKIKEFMLSLDEVRPHLISLTEHHLKHNEIDITRHLEMSNILSKQQFGFRAKYSTEQVAFSLINRILAALNNNQITGGIFCDLHTAFDYVNHKILLDKLQFYGIHGKFNMLIQSYFTNRYQKVT